MGWVPQGVMQDDSYADAHAGGPHLASWECLEAEVSRDFSDSCHLDQIGCSPFLSPWGNAELFPIFLGNSISHGCFWPQALELDSWLFSLPHIPPVC